jgi:hypothetical protein
MNAKDLRSAEHSSFYQCLDSSESETFYQKKTQSKSKILPVLGTSSDLHKEHGIRLGLSCSKSSTDVLRGKK